MDDHRIDDRRDCSSLVFGLILGVLGVMQSKVANAISSAIIYIFRGLPMIVLAFFIYMGVPNVIGHKVPLFLAGVVTLMLDEGAYIGAIVKGGFDAVDPGQWEAARSLGLPYRKALVKVVAPQGIKIMVPSLVNQFIMTSEGYLDPVRNWGHGTDRNRDRYHLAEHGRVPDVADYRDHLHYYHYPADLVVKLYSKEDGLIWINDIRYKLKTSTRVTGTMKSSREST